jgi:hypothetical protein
MKPLLELPTVLILFLLSLVCYTLGARDNTGAEIIAFPNIWVYCDGTRATFYLDTRSGTLYYLDPHK